jgi:glc operon protein GlcG
VLLLAATMAAAAQMPLRAELPVKTVLTLEAAKKVGAAAEAEALKRGATVVIVVVDDGGHVLFLERLNDTQVASVEVGIGKARTAAIFRRPSKVFEDQIREGRIASLVLPGATPLQGGVPLLVDGRVVGAIGVSGNPPQEDEEIAKAGAAALSGVVSATPHRCRTGRARTWRPRLQRAACFLTARTDATTWSMRAIARDRGWPRSMRSTQTSSTSSRARQPSSLAARSRAAR